MLRSLFRSHTPERIPVVLSPPKPAPEMKSREEIDALQGQVDRAGRLQDKAVLLSTRTVQHAVSVEEKNRAMLRGLIRNMDRAEN